MAVKIGNLAKTVLKELENYGIETAVVVEKVVDEVGQDTAKELQKTSPKLTGDYAGAWTYSKGDTKRTKYSRCVHVDKPEYALSHLLENGHQKRDGGRTQGIKHIAPAEKHAVEKLEKGIREKI